MNNRGVLLFLALLVLGMSHALARMPFGGGQPATTLPVPPTPYGGITPPAGKRWVLTLDDEFNQDSTINPSMWNLGHGGPFPLCQPSPGIDQLGWSGNDTCAPFGGNSSSFVAPYDAIVPGVGLYVQDLNYYQDQTNSQDTNQDWMGIQNYGKFSQIYGYYEVRAKEPTDYHGEGDGLHPDIWFTTNNRTQLDGQAEVDIAENDLGPNTRQQVSCTVNQNGAIGTSVFMPSPTVGDLSQAFHTYAVAWTNTGSSYGTVQCYFDGVAQGSPFTLTDSSFGTGVFFLPGWMQQIEGSPYFGGAATTAATSNNNPLIIQYVRVWQAE